MRVTWTEAKRVKTLHQRGLDFCRAGDVFAGLHATRGTHGGTAGETRFITAGFLDARMVVMVWTTRGAARHIISMRYAHAKEQKLWQKEMDRFR
ncbi:MAG: BrnT family toxin [Alphaproteobacteria bacterium]|nr:MAG: BrnT family toxin [Alphaproteobacteria bacterium]